MSAQQTLENILSQAEPQANGCLLRTGKNKNSMRYWPTKVHGKMMGAHRAVWTLSRGPIPAGLCVCHSCDDKRCVNLDHLWLGTRQDNVNDMVQKGRARKPEGSRFNDIDWQAAREKTSRLPKWPLLKLDEVAVLFGVSCDRARMWVKRHELPCVRFDARTFRFRSETLAKWAEKREGAECARRAAR